MITYRPVQKPFFQRVFGNTFVQLLLLAAVVVAVFSFARQQRRIELANRIAELENPRSTQVVSRRSAESASRSDFASNAPTESKAQPQAQADGSKSSAPNPPAGAASAYGVAANETASTAVPGGAPAEDTARSAAGASAKGGSAPTPQGAQVSFAAVSRAAIAELVASADPRATAAMGPFTTGVVSQVANKFKALQSTEYFELLDSSTRGIKINQPVEFYGGQRDSASGTFLGFVIEVTAVQFDENDSHLHLQVSRYMREGTELDSMAIPVPDTIVIPRGGGAFISGALFNKRASTPIERQLYDPIKVLHILATEAYRSNYTDLLILVEPK